MSGITITMSPVAVTREHAARLLGMSTDSFERHVQAEVKMIRRGKLRLVPVSELERWAERNAEHVLDGAVRGA
jgi:hypothetical protein